MYRLATKRTEKTSRRKRESEFLRQIITHYISRAIRPEFVWVGSGRVQNIDPRPNLLQQPFFFWQFFR